MKRFLVSCALFLAGLSGPASAATDSLCVLVEDVESGKTLRKEGGACDERVTPASTFKLAISLMGFDAGVLEDAKTPKLPFKAGYVDWRPEWRQATTPESWMRDSVVWYSQRVMERLGEKRARGYLDSFAYGNQEMSGLPGMGAGLTHAWLSSSLKISPREQADFMKRIVRRELGVADHAYEMTAKIASYGIKGEGWRVYGKTGAGLPRSGDGEMVRGRAYGWFVGWAEKDDRRIVFAKLVQDREKQKVPPGFRARDSLFDALFSGNGLLR